ncbi:MAG: glycine/betaine ABC transporter substrate-binding protein [Gordonia sp.]|uniref:ABC transporter substrate-binding protein n=1 Tax=Gordonia rubripertincta TaxID=36822 RepID=A0ABT4MYJ2_GORRU|nr:ABC transporter substrate-binding protein [Gordonia rubripertincta]MBA4023564.1 glycine/betaine ABC transporter substrate-binding protein [Gordonia sp. (in: high G+C Gram-positive bacteria)]MCZ4551126.1 ABC transporter substrate-binding protein [Gordonia rubripertincta]
MHTLIRRDAWLRFTLLPAILLLIAAMVAGCFDPLSRAGSRDPDPNHIVVGSGGVLESQIIGQIYIDALEANGFTVENQLNSGTRERYLPALRSGDIDLVPDYIGNLMQYLASTAPGLTEDQVAEYSALTSLEDIEQKLPTVEGDDLLTYTPAPGSNSDSVTVTQKSADKWNLKSIEDLARVSQTEKVSFMANSEFATREVGVPGLERNYGLKVDFRPNNDSGGQATINELTGGRVTAADIYTTTPAITTENLVVLEDPKHNFPANNIVPVLAKTKDSPKLRAVLDAVSSKLTVEELRNLNELVSGKEKLEVEDAAKRWVETQNLNKALGS